MARSTTPTRARRARRKAPGAEPGLGANFEGDCARCPQPIRRGDRIVFNRGSAIHVSCAAGQDDE